jgi:phosphopantothenoylcysteine decarboxylase/phosphopantothenate--cysteine ligase
MGYALAQAAAEAGAIVTLISGPVTQPTPERVSRIDITSASDMYHAVHRLMKSCDLFIGAAAVADYRPVAVAREKIKKDCTQDSGGMSLQLVRNADIVASVAKLAHKPFVVGFAAETRDLINYAREKMQRKNLDMIIANNVAEKTIGFNSDENEVSVLSMNTEVTLTRTSKSNLARQLIQLIGERMSTGTPGASPMDPNHQ